jgi:hypothetical protein
VVEHDGLVKQRDIVFFPMIQIIQERIKARFDLLPGNADVQVDSSKYPGPFPHTTKHFFVELSRPFQVKRSHSPIWLGGQILDDNLANIFRFEGIQLRSRRYAFGLQA